MKARICVIFFASILSFSSCNKEETGIPDVPVNVTIYSSDPLFNDLNPIGGYLYYPGGSRGLLIYRKSMEEIVAYDRHCPYQPEKSCGKISVDSSNTFIAIDGCCNSKFLLLDGSVNAGPSSYPLKAYYSSFDGYKLTVYN